MGKLQNDLLAHLAEAAEVGAKFAKTTADPGKVTKVTKDHLASLIGAGSGADRVVVYVSRPYAIGGEALVRVSLPVQIDGYWYTVGQEAKAVTTA